MITLKHKDLLDARVHFGHLTSKWHPNMAPFIFMERNGIHIIDLNKTLLQLQEATHALKALASAGKRILFVATKKQAKAVVAQEAKRLGMPYVTERWLGGTLTNFVTIRRLIKKMSSFDKLMRDAAYQNMAKKEQLMIAREKAKLARLLQGIADTTRLPAALFVVDIKREHIAVKEAQKLGIPVFALTDTNADPTGVDYPIPSNDDASRSIEVLVKAIASALADGLAERKKHQAEDPAGQEGATLKRASNKGAAEATQQPAKVQAPAPTATPAAQATKTKQAPETKEVASTKTAPPVKKTTTKPTVAAKKTTQAQEPGPAAEEKKTKATTKAKATAAKVTQKEPPKQEE